MTQTDKETFEIERILPKPKVLENATLELDDLEIYVQSHIKGRRVISAIVLARTAIRKILKS